MGYLKKFLETKAVRKTSEGFKVTLAATILALIVTSPLACGAAFVKWGEYTTKSQQRRIEAERYNQLPEEAKPYDIDGNGSLEPEEVKALLRDYTPKIEQNAASISSGTR